MKKRKFADGGETTEMRPSAKPEGGRFDEDTYSRARRFVESGGKKEETKSAVKKERKVEVKPPASEAKQSTGRAEIPIDPNGPKAPASTGEDTSGPSNLSRILSAGGAGVGALGTAAALRTAGHANRAAKRVADAAKMAAKEKRGAGEAPPGKTSSDGMPGKDYADYKKGGKVKKYAAGGSVGSASRRADGIATKGKTRCKVV